MFNRILAASIALIVNGPVTGHAQSLMFHPERTFGSVDDPASVGPMAEAARMSDGRVLISSPEVGGEVMVFGPEGDLQRMVGREGEGPGEFGGWVSLRVLPGDTIMALDGRLGRVTLLSPGFDALETLPVDRSMDAAVSGAWLVTSGTYLSGDRVYGLRVMGRDGSEPTLHGGADADADELNVYFLIRELTVAPDGSVWSVTMNRPVIERWEPGAGFRERFRFTAEPRLLEEYLPAEAMSVAERQEAGPPSNVIGLDFDPEGNLLLYAVLGRPLGERSGPPAVEEMYETHVYRLDAETGETLARGTHPGLLRPLGGGWAYDTVETALGDRRVRVGSIR